MVVWGADQQMGTSQVSPNGVQIDSVISILLHELAETAISPSLKQSDYFCSAWRGSSPCNDHRPDQRSGSAFADSKGLEPGEKCQGVLLNVQPSLNNANVCFNNQCFLVFPFYYYNGGNQGWCAMW